MRELYIISKYTFDSVDDTNWWKKFVHLTNRVIVASEKKKKTFIAYSATPSSCEVTESSQFDCSSVSSDSGSTSSRTLYY